MRLGLFTLLLCLAGAPTAFAQPSASAPAVIELFTSQGCSSCPKADALLAKYAVRSDLIALSLPVDYWDHLGWKDTLANPKNSARQKRYVKALGSGNVYTPQMVINGIAQAIGSHKADIDKAIAETSKRLNASRVAVSAANSDNRVVVEIGEGKAVAPATIWLVVVSPQVDVQIKRGENRGRVLTYHNVVRDIAPVGMWSGKSMRIELPASVMTKAGDRCAVLLQGDDGGRILGAAWMTP